MNAQLTHATIALSLFTLVTCQFLAACNNNAGPIVPTERVQVPGPVPSPAATPSVSQSLYNKYGGAAMITKVVDDAVTGLVADCKENPYFTTVLDMPGHDTTDRLKSCLDLFFTNAFGGPATYPGPSHFRNAPPEGYPCEDMTTIHDGLGIPSDVFDQFVTDLGSALKTDGVSDADITTIAGSLNGLKGQVIAQPGFEQTYDYSPTERQAMAVQSKSLLKIGAAFMALSAALLIAGMGYLHTPAGSKLPIGRKILTLLGIECPLGKNLTAGSVEDSRERGMQALRGSRFTLVRPALGLILDQTDTTQALQWSKGHRLKCTPLEKGMHFLRCLEPGTEGVTTLAFNPSGKLVAVDVFRRRVSKKSIDPLLKATASYLTSQLGNPHQTLGEMSSLYLLKDQNMKTAFLEYHFSNYIAKLTASYLPWSGLMEHEQYSSALVATTARARSF